MSQHETETVINHDRAKKLPRFIQLGEYRGHFLLALDNEGRVWEGQLESAEPGVPRRPGALDIAWQQTAEWVEE